MVMNYPIMGGKGGGYSEEIYWVGVKLTSTGNLSKLITSSIILVMRNQRQPTSA